MVSSRLTIIALAVGVCTTTGCQGISNLRDKTAKSMRAMLSDSYHDDEADAKMAKAQELYDAGEFRAAQRLFADLADNTFNPHLLAEKARFLEAECLRERRHLTDAVATYHRQLQDHPAGAYREQAANRMYEIAYTEWLEKDVLADIEAEQAGEKRSWWQRQRIPNPFDDTRPTFDLEGEALKTLENAHTHDIVGPNADKSLYWCGYVHYMRGRYEDADHFFSQLIENHKDSKLRPLALEMAITAKNLSTGGAVYDSQKAAEALQLVHHAEATDPEFARNQEKKDWLTTQKLGVRMQLAQKDFEMAKYYERTRNPAPAYFYYELVCRRYPGTKYSEMAKIRLGELDKVRQQMEADRAAGKYEGTSGAITRQWDRFMGKPVDPANVTPDTLEPKTPLQPLPPDITNQR